MQKLLMICLSTLITVSSVFSQVTISPTSLFLDSKSRFQTVLIMNGSSDAQEIELGWQFGYPKTDELGNMSMVYDDSLLAAKYSAADWIRGFPKKFILAPGARQTIRVTVKAPRKLEDGTYWSRLITKSSAVSPPVGAVQPDGIRAQINFKFRQVTSVFYKHGDLNTGIEIKDLSNSFADQQLILLAKIQKLGNSPFLGTMETQIFDSKGEMVKKKFAFTSIYFNGNHRMRLDVGDLPKGNYSAQVSFLSGRADIPDSDIIPADDVSLRSDFTIR